MPDDSAAMPVERMIRHLRYRGITDERVLEAMRKIPRDQFVPEAIRDQAWDDNALPVGCGQTISQPYIVAWMSELLELTGLERVLEVGTGTGYQTAILARLARRVVSIERLGELSAAAARRLEELQVENVELVVGDGTLGWPDDAPYDAILVAAGAPQIPQPLYEQLVLGGRLVLPVGNESSQQMQSVRRTTHGQDVESLGGCRFVPLIGEAGWDETTE